MKKIIIILVSVIIVTVVLSLYMKWDSFGVKRELSFSSEMTLKELAIKNDVPLKEILHILSHDNLAVWNLSREKPIKDLPLSSDDIEHALGHIAEEDRPFRDVAKYILWAVWLSFVLVVVLSKKKIQNLRKIILLFTILIFGVILGATPNPMESIVKLFKMLNGMEGDPKGLITGFILFSIFSLLGSKLICSWGCQLGALQESVFNIPLFKKKYAFQIPFVISLSVRVIIFIVFFMLLFGLGRGVIMGVRDFVIYHQVNYFKIFNFHDLAVFALLTLPIFVIASFFIFRPFCQFICPFGLYSWLLENVAVNKIKIIDDKCTECKKCVKACPTQAMKGIYEGKRRYFLPDCWSCGLCIEECPTNAVVYGDIKK